MKDLTSPAQTSVSPTLKWAGDLSSLGTCQCPTGHSQTTWSGAKCSEVWKEREPRAGTGRHPGIRITGYLQFL